MNVDPNMNRRKLISSLSSIGLFSLAGCSSGDDGVQDSDDDGMVDSQDYAPNDPDVQEKSDIQKSPTQTPTPTPKPTSTPTPTPTSTPLPDSDGDGIVDRRDDFPENANFSQLINEDSGTESIDPGYYRWWKWSLEEPAVFSFELDVISGSHIDAVLIDESEFSKFENGKEYSYHTNGSDFETKLSDKHLKISSGTYRFILSNYNTGKEETSKVKYRYGNAR